MKKITKIVSSLVLIAILQSNAQNPVLLKDVNATFAGNANPSKGVEISGILYFSANSSQGGIELWKSDGTSAGTMLVKDIYPGNTTSNPSNLTSFNSKLYFTATDPVNGVGSQELWVSDGTSVGTQVIDINTAGTAGSGASYLTVYNAELYFQANAGGSYGAELYKIDMSGVLSLVKDIYSGGGSGNPKYLTIVNSTLYFAATTSAAGQELWKTDGSAAGTVLVKDIYSGGTGSISTNNFATVGNTLFFVANDGLAGAELWKSDGTAAGTVLVDDIYPGSSGNSSSPYSLMAVGSTLFFGAYNTTYGTELWKSDGTLAGTMIVNDIYGGSSSLPSTLGAVGTTLYFSATNATYGNELWKSDGTSAGTTMVADINPNTTVLSGYSTPNGMIVVGTTIYFSAYDPNYSSNMLWESDGSSAGTVKPKNSSGSYIYNPTLSSLTGAAGFYFSSNNTYGFELWKSDGTQAGTAMVKQIGVGNTYGAAISNMTKVGTKFFFSASDGINGTELFKSDGTAAGTVLVSNINNTSVASGSSSPSSLATDGTTLYFNANDGINGTELWKSDGSTTSLVKDINPNTTVLSGNSSPSALSVVGSSVYFQANDGVNGAELWVSDGTAGNTKMLNDINAGGGSSSPSKIVSISSTKILFVATTAANGQEMWVTDGTSANTMMLKDINSAGAGSSSPNNLTLLGTNVVFSATDGTGDTELWISDGTTAGTMLVSNVYSAGSSNPSNFAVMNGVLYFSATTSIGNELWRSDGTLAGTTLVKDIYNSGASSSNPTGIVVIGNAIAFSATTSTYGTELWKSDGTAAGTVLVKDIKSGSTSSSPASITAFGLLAVFQANDGTNGAEFWVSDGSDAGTMIKDIAAGSTGSGASNMLNMNNSYLAFTADDGFTATELYKYTSPVMITTGTVTAVQCAGGAISLPYTITQGAVSGSNSFQIQLSDGLGSFTNPTVIGSTPGTSSTGTATGTIPAGVSGLTYKVRVASTNDPSYATSNDQPILISTPPVAISGNLTFCSGSSTNLVANGGVSYAWSGAQSSSSQIIVANIAGDLTATATDVYGCTNAQTVAVVQETAPTISVTGNTSYCLGDYTTLSASGALTYSWSPTTGLSNANAAVVNVAVSGSQTYVVTGMGVACSATKTVNIIVDACVGGLGVNNPADNKVMVYPNPASSSLTIQSNSTGTTTIKLINTQGSEVYSETYTSQNSLSSKTLDVTKHSKGVYWLQVITNNKTTITKIILE